MRGRQLAWLLYDHYRIRQEEGAMLEFGDLIHLTLKGDNLLAFQNGWEITLSSIHHAHYSLVQSPFPTRGSTVQHRPRPRPTSRLLGVEYIPPCLRPLAEVAVEAAGERRAVPAPARRSCAARSPKGSPLSN